MKIRLLFNSGNDKMKPERTGFNIFNSIFNNRVTIALNSVFVITINHKLNSVAIWLLFKLKISNYFSFVRIIIGTSMDPCLKTWICCFVFFSSFRNSNEFHPCSNVECRPHGTLKYATHFHWNGKEVLWNT